MAYRGVTLALRVEDIDLAADRELVERWQAGEQGANIARNALLAAGLGNVNLIKVSSIVPPAVTFIERPKLKPGALIPTAYAAMTSETPGERVAAAVGYAVPDDPAKNGVIMEFHGVASRAEAEARRRRTRALLRRDTPIISNGYRL